VQPMYQRIAGEIRAQIHAGLLKPGDKLPSTREMCEQYDVSVTVVRLAVLVLRSEGLVVGISGKGVYIV
jgi:GntR family transcriptional regulator